MNSGLLSMAFATSSKDLGCGPAGAMGAPFGAEVEAVAMAGGDEVGVCEDSLSLGEGGLIAVMQNGTKQSKQGGSL